MIQRLGRRQYKVYAMDIESHNDSESIAKQETSCWLGCLLDETSKWLFPSSLGITSFKGQLKQKQKQNIQERHSQEMSSWYSRE